MRLWDLWEAQAGRTLANSEERKSRRKPSSPRILLGRLWSRQQAEAEGTILLAYGLASAGSQSHHSGFPGAISPGLAFIRRRLLTDLWLVIVAVGMRAAHTRWEGWLLQSAVDAGKARGVKRVESWARNWASAKCPSTTLKCPACQKFARSRERREQIHWIQLQDES